MITTGELENTYVLDDPGCKVESEQYDLNLLGIKGLADYADESTDFDTTNPLQRSKTISVKEVRIIINKDTQTAFKVKYVVSAGSRQLDRVKFRKEKNNEHALSELDYRSLADEEMHIFHLISSGACANLLIRKLSSVISCCTLFHRTVNRLGWYSMEAEDRACKDAGYEPVVLAGVLDRGGFKKSKYSEKQIFIPQALYRMRLIMMSEGWRCTLCAFKNENSQFKRYPDGYAITLADAWDRSSDRVALEYIREIRSINDQLFDCQAFVESRRDKGEDINL